LEHDETRHDSPLNGPQSTRGELARMVSELGNMSNLMRPSNNEYRRQDTLLFADLHDGTETLVTLCEDCGSDTLWI